jgi:FtsP/CotA-like multicopper oxidase with cupredoxin domain
MKFQPRSVAPVGLMLLSVAAVSFVRDVNRVDTLARSEPSAQMSTTTTNVLAPVLPVANPCPRFNAGSVVHNPPALFSSNGFLRVRFSYQQRIDHDGMELLCFMTPDGLVDPTLHVKPGDHLIITITNNTPSTPAMMPRLNPPNCGDAQPTQSSINIHYHGTNTSPACHQDNVIKTVINPGETFQYNVAFPTNEPSGLYWYHPHIHMLAERSTQAGATGAIVVDGIENQQPAVSGLRQRVLMVRDQLVPGNPLATGNIPSFDLTLNYILIASPTDPNSTDFVPAVLRMQPGKKELWRVSNSSADVTLDLQYVFDRVPQTLQLVAIDGVPLNSQDGARPGSLTKVTHFTLPNASRVEFIVSAPPSSVRVAQLITQGITAGFGIYNDPRRPLATVQLTSGEDDSAAVQDADVGTDNKVGTFTAMSTTQNRFAGLASAPVAMKRTVFFDENVNVIPPQFFMAVQGLAEHVFDPNAPPDIVATQGTVEEWTVENRTIENHAFHIHQIHFLVESQNNFEINGSPQVSADNGQYLDTIQVPFWDQNPSHPFPSVTLRIDFRGNDIGDFVFHCHILSHEDLGMMNIVRVRTSPAPD